MAGKPLTPAQRVMLEATNYALQDLWEACRGDKAAIIAAIGSMLETTLKSITDDQMRENATVAFIKRLGGGMGLGVHTLHRLDS